MDGRKIQKNISLVLCLLKNDGGWDGPWLCAGDLNQILYNEEAMRDQKLLDDFRLALEDCDLLDCRF